ncbi:AraC family transcriptional regulator, partial [Bacteroides xylanisolvens]
MKQNLTLILMNEAVREGWREWMEKVRRVLPQTDAERPVTWIAAERLARENGRMVRLVELLREHRPVLSFRVQEEAGLLILVAYHRHGNSADFLLDTAEAYFREKDCGGFLFLCRMQASINAYDEYPHLNVLCNRLAGLLFRFRRERESEYRKGIPPMFGKADLQEVEKYLPH